MILSPATCPSLAKRNASRHLDALTGLRFVAAMGVVVYHFGRPALQFCPQPLLNLAGAGFAAVSFFFLLSGFILSYSYIDRGGEIRGTKREFYVSRFARIYPAYLLGFLIALPYNVRASLHVNSLRLALLKLVASASVVLTMVQAWTPWTAWAWNYPAWSISVEAFFYLTFPWIAPKLARLPLSRCWQAFAGMWILSLVAPILLLLCKGTSSAPQLGDHLQMFVEFNPLLRLPEFVTGILLGRMYKLGGPFGFRVSRFPAPLLGALLGILAFLPEIPHPLLANGLLVPLFALLILGLAEDKGRSLLSRVLALPAMVILGEASYGIYILQVPLSYALLQTKPYSSLTMLSLYLIALTVTASISWKYVESPLRLYLRRRLSGNERKLSITISEISLAEAPRVA